MELAYPGEEFFLARAYPDPYIDQRVVAKQLERARAFESLRSDEERFQVSWDVQGPGNIGARVNTLAVQPGNDQLLLAGFSSGGIFRSLNKGKDWEPVFDDKLALSIGDITFDQNNPQVAFAGTGDPNIGGYPSVGNGLYKSDNAGESWHYSGLSEVGIISKVAVHPANSQVVICAAMGFPFMPGPDRGLYRSTDGGDSWEQILFLSDTTGVTDFLIHPDDPDVIIAAGWDRIRNNRESVLTGNGARLYRTTNGGEDWEILSDGLPNTEYSRIGLVMAPSDPDILYAQYIGTPEGPDCGSHQYQLAHIFRSWNGGDSWEEIPTKEVNGLDCNALGNFGWYFAKIRVHPQNPEEIYVLGVDLWRTENGGNLWRRAGPPWFLYEVHADKHDLVFVGDSMILTTDGGIYIAASDNTDEWRDIENIVATQFYRVAYNPHKPNLYYGGAQDNGSTGGNKSMINEWPRIFGGDGFQMHFHREDSLIFYTMTQRGSIHYTVDGGQDFESFSFDPGSTKFWDMPFVMSHHRSELLYAGSNALWRAPNAPGSFWEPVSMDLTKGDTLPLGYPSITAIAESPVDSTVLLVGTQDGKVWASGDYGAFWEDVTPGLPDRFVTSVAASHHVRNKLYVAHSAYRDGDNTAFLHVSENGGADWVNIAGDLPQLSINHILIFPEKGDSVLFVATDGGVYGTVDAGTHWERVGKDFPYIPVYHLVYNPVRNELVAGTFARGIQSFPLDSVSLEVEPPSSVEFSGSALDNIKVWPSPTSGIVNFELPEDLKGDYFLHVHSLQGESLHKEMIEKHSPQIQADLSYLPDGVLIVTISDKEKSRAFRIIKSRN